MLRAARFFGAALLALGLAACEAPSSAPSVSPSSLPAEQRAVLVDAAGNAIVKSFNDRRGQDIGGGMVLRKASRAGDTVVLDLQVRNADVLRSMRRNPEFSTGYAEGLLEDRFCQDQALRLIIEAGLSFQMNFQDARGTSLVRAKLNSCSG